jgi:hypothetical protein
MKPDQALKEIANALNAAIQKGVFADVQSAAFIFNCLNVIEQAIKTPEEKTE